MVRINSEVFRHLDLSARGRVDARVGAHCKLEVKSAAVQKPQPISVLKAIEEALQEAGYPSLRRVEVVIEEGGEVRLRGELPTWYMKQVAQQIIGGLEEVRELHNEIKVVGTC